MTKVIEGEQPVKSKEIQMLNPMKVETRAPYKGFNFHWDNYLNLFRFQDSGVTKRIPSNYSENSWMESVTPLSQIFCLKSLCRPEVYKEILISLSCQRQEREIKQNIWYSIGTSKAIIMFLMTVKKLGTNDKPTWRCQ